MEKLPCPIDRASEREMEILDDSRRAISNQVPQKRRADTVLSEDDLTCEECGEPNSIPPERALAGYTMCVACKSFMEKQNKRFNSRRYRDNEDYF